MARLRDLLQNRLNLGDLRLYGERVAYLISDSPCEGLDFFVGDVV